MRELESYADARLEQGCRYCGGESNTVDHVPAKAFLDKPFPYLPTVPACLSCNQEASKDEEYVACLVEVAIVGSTTSDQIRPRVRAMLDHAVALSKRINESRIENADGIFWNPEANRVTNVVVKLARGHASYEASAPWLGEPSSVQISPFGVLDNDERDEFERCEGGPLWPEVGSRAMIRAVESESGLFGQWVVVQPGRYRYRLTTSDGLAISMVIGEYLAATVVWR